MPLAQLLSKFAGSAGGDSPLSALFNSPGTQGAVGGALSGVAVSLLMHKKSRKKLGKTVGKVGGAAAIAGVGYLGWGMQQSPVFRCLGIDRGRGPVTLRGCYDRARSIRFTISGS